MNLLACYADFMIFSIFSKSLKEVTTDPAPLCWLLTLPPIFFKFAALRFELEFWF